MDSLPPELVYAMASWLPRSDLCSLRLVSHYIATATFGITVKHLFVLDTSSSLGDFLGFLRSRGSKLPTRSLTIYCGDWSRCTKDEWLVHPLLRREHMGNSIPHGKSVTFSATAEAAYLNYTKFLDEEDGRYPAADSEVLRSILKCMPNLKSTVLSPLHRMGSPSSHNPKMEALVRHVWMLPSPRCSIKTVQRFLELSGNFNSIDELVINGKLHLGREVIGRSEKIRILRVNSATSSCRYGLMDFLSAFPNLQVLQLSMRITTAIPLNYMFLPKLRSVLLQRVEVSERSLLETIVRSPHLETIRLADSVLASGTWHSLFSRLHSSGHSIQIKLDVDLNGEMFTYPPYIN